MNVNIYRSQHKGMLQHTDTVLDLKSHLTADASYPGNCTAKRPMPVDGAVNCNIATFRNSCPSLLKTAACSMHDEKHPCCTGYTLWAAGSPVKQPTIAAIPVFTPVLASSRVVAHACGRRRLQGCCLDTSPLPTQLQTVRDCHVWSYCAT